MEKCHSNRGIAIVIPVYNRAKILQETLQYVIAQTLPPNKLIIVDDGSTDDTATQTEKWLSNHAGHIDWKVIRKPKSTAAKTRNVGFSHIEDAQYVAFLDSDDHWPDDFLERCVKSLESRPDAVAATTERSYRMFLNGPTQSAGGLDLTSDPITWIFKHGGGITSCSLLRSRIVADLGGWPEVDPSEDTELFCMMSLKGPWVIAEGKPVIFNIGNASQKEEECNLSSQYADREERWVARLENIYEKITLLDPSIRTAPLKKAMASRWHRASKFYKKIPKWHKARSCINRSLYWNPWRWKYRKASLKIRLKK